MEAIRKTKILAQGDARTKTTLIPYSLSGSIPILQITIFHLQIAKTVQYLAGHENSKITMDIYAKVKYNRPEDVVKTMGSAFAQWDNT